MHILLVYNGSLDFVWYISLVSSIVAGIDGGEGSSGREFISRVQMQVLFERIPWGWSYKVEGAFDEEKWEYFMVH
jgi:hypothetical protein